MFSLGDFLGYYQVTVDVDTSGKTPTISYAGDVNASNQVPINSSTAFIILQLSEAAEAAGVVFSSVSETAPAQALSFTGVDGAPLWARASPSTVIVYNMNVFGGLVGSDPAPVIMNYPFTVSIFYDGQNTQSTDPTIVNSDLNTGT